LVGKPERKRKSDDLGVDGRIILEWILGKYNEKFWTGCVWLRIATSGGSCGHGYEPPGSIRDGKFIC